MSNVHKKSIHIMKKWLFIIVLAIHPLSSISQIGLCSYVDHCWGDWKFYNIKAYGTYDEISFFQPGDHPSQWQWKFKISDYKVPSKKELKSYRRSNKWLVYNGTFEYYIDDDNLSIQDMIREDGCPIINPTNHRVDKGERPCKRQTVNAVIKIKPFKKNPQVYNIFFEGVGMGFDLTYY